MLSWRTAHKLALSLPEAEEQGHFGSPSFRVRGKIFAQLSSEDDEGSALVKLSKANQAALLMSDPATFTAPQHWGSYGWTTVRLANIDDSLMLELLVESWRSVAPKTLVTKHEEGK